MTIIERTSYVFNYPEEKEEADEFERTHTEWIKSISTRSVCFSKTEHFQQVLIPIERKEDYDK